MSPSFRSKPRDPFFHVWKFFFISTNLNFYFRTGEKRIDTAIICIYIWAWKNRHKHATIIRWYLFPPHTFVFPSFRSRSPLHDRGLMLRLFFHLVWQLLNHTKKTHIKLLFFIYFSKKMEMKIETTTILPNSITKRIYMDPSQLESNLQLIPVSPNLLEGLTKISVPKSPSFLVRDSRIPSFWKP